VQKSSPSNLSASAVEHTSALYEHSSARHEHGLEPTSIEGPPSSRSFRYRTADAQTPSRTIVAVTDRHLPLLLTTFRGELTLEAVQRHSDHVTELIEQQLARRSPIVYVVDARGLSMPSAMIRRYWADQVNKSSSTLAALLGTFIVVDNTFLRGALTAIAWMTDAAKSLEYSPSLDDAVERANTRLVARGYPPSNFHPSTHATSPWV
jgi:hypothetical protein